MENQATFEAPFSPTIMTKQMSTDFVDTVNEASDIILADPDLYAMFDWTSELVGKVKKQFQLAIKDDRKRDYVIETIQSLGMEYLNHLIGKKASRTWAGGTAGINNIKVVNNWIVSQQAGEYNPWHDHSGEISGVIYLKIPEGMFVQNVENKYSCDGKLEIGFGDFQDLRMSTLLVEPQVGRLYMFPSYLRHTAYPFNCEGERRCMSFNLEIVI